MNNYFLYCLVPFSPMIGAVVSGFFGKSIGRVWTHRLAIFFMLISVVASVVVLINVLNGEYFNGSIYTWGEIGGLLFEVGFLVDRLSATLMLVVGFVSLMVHIYTIGYMAEDSGYQRFFCYLSLFTFAMLMLVMSNNFLQLFFGWEAVGLVSYLLIGFWYKKSSAIHANLKAFLVNRVGDFGFLLGIGLIFAYFGSLDYETVFDLVDSKAEEVFFIRGDYAVSVITMITVLLFVGAMGKSAQFPLHVWLPDSMEGPTPISALIHAATMVTAGIFMVARMSPLFELSETALSFVLVVGATTALFAGLLGIVQNDIKRVIAYSTLSQLGYMTVALGISAYGAAIFHLTTHAFFKALLFLAAGSVIIGMHHQQDIRKMGGLRRYMPITWFTTLLGSLALIGFPFTSGFYSKESIIEAVSVSSIAGSSYAYFAVTAGVFVTALYTFRMYFLVFEGPERFRDSANREGNENGHHSVMPTESPFVVWLPLVLLAIPSVFFGAFAIKSVLYDSFFQQSIIVLDNHNVFAKMPSDFSGWLGMGLHGFFTIPFGLAIFGVLVSWLCYVRYPMIPIRLSRALKLLYELLRQKYYFDRFYDWFFVGGARYIGEKFWVVGDVRIIDGLLVNGSARVVSIFSGFVRQLQSGLIYHYAFLMIIGVFILLTLWFWKVYGV